MNRREMCVTVAAAALLPALSGRARAAALPRDLSELTLARASAAIRDGSITSRDLTSACLQRIANENPRINALITVMRDEALAQAGALDTEAQAGRFRSRLHGIPIALKDAIDTAGVRTTAASALLEKRVPSEDAFVVRRLQQAGAIVIAKANLGEFSLTHTSSHFGPVRNPWALDHATGGSSSGSAAAVATRMCLGALGTDSGGSVRIPAAWCGIVGLKPTDGLVSNTGIIPSLAAVDTCGPLARSVEDVALLFSELVGHDPLNPASIDRPREDYAASMRQPVSGLRIGVPRKPFFDDVDPQITRAVEKALQVLSGLTRSVNDVALPSTAKPLDGRIGTAQIYSYHRDTFTKHADSYTPAVRKMLRNMAQYLDDPATGTPSAKVAAYLEAYAEFERNRLTIDAAFKDFDVTVMPTMRTFPPTLKASMDSENGPGPNNEGLISIYNTFAFNALGLPAISVPCGFSAAGLPIGLMIGGPRFSEGRLLALAAAYERSTEWHKRAPGRQA